MSQRAQDELLKRRCLWMRFLQPGRPERDVFATRYRLNTPTQLRRHFPADRFDVVAYTHDPEPSYFGRSTLAWRAVNAVTRLLPSRLGTTLMVFVRKR